MKTETYLGRRLKVKRGREWGTLVTFINGESNGSEIGTDEMKAMESLRRWIDAADIRRVDDPEAYGEHYYRGAPADIVAAADAAFLRLYGWERTEA